MPTAPAFWGRKPGPAAHLLFPIGAAWEMAGRLRRRLARPYAAPVPVVCIGNLVVGGAGKTPVTLALATWFKAHGLAAHVVTRGYGGRIAGPCRVDAGQHDAATIGDEALLLAATAPCWVARDRAAGAAAAAAGGAQIVLLDDGFQNPAIAKSVSLVVIDAAFGFGNGRVMPAGPLREDWRRGLARAEALVMLTTQGERPSVPPPPAPGKPVIAAELTAVDGERFAGQRVFAFAGIGRPQRFFATLRAVGADIVGERRFPDHYRYRPRDIAALAAAARREHARLVTTAKDYVRLPATLRAAVETLDVELLWCAPEMLARLFAPILSSAAPHADPQRAAAG